ncbi:MAG: adenylosuccinate synthase [Peptococcaceae bacterium]|jgi:adenylosuccinate synthase|nr:adenylosuccinate synthase [Peptococcaceae bacterium]
MMMRDAGQGELTAIVGINWGDEGKGRMVDLISQDFDIVVRYQGGNNAGHTVINEKGKFILNLLPSGILRPEIVNVMGNGMVIDLEHLWGEMESLRAKGLDITPANLKISHLATICLPYHKTQDIYEEDRLGEAKQGSTRRGIGPVYGDKYLRKSLRLGDLLYPELLAKQAADLVAWKNLTLAGYGQAAIDLEATLAWLRRFGEPLRPYISDTGAFLDQAAAAGKRALFEAQLGALRDIDFGIYPYTTSSSAIAAYAPIGSGIPNRRLDRIIGVMKAYSSSVGGGPFTCELSGEAEKALREAGGEYGAATGRPRRVGPFDGVASRYGVRIQGAGELALTKLDVLSYLEKIPVCVAYEIKGDRREDFPWGSELAAAKPIYIYLDGWREDISGCRRFGDLPPAARDYISYLEKLVNCPVSYVSVGASRDQYLMRE